ncbi:MAG: tyrosine-type recombinase/integrase [Bryobacterales bacterium]|nr:tyrosine-type recombinase/integrase [Bryobacterales bacterium]
MGRDPQTGKRQYINETVHGNKKDAEGVLTKKMRDRDTGELTPRNVKHNVDGLLDDLLFDYKTNGKDYDWAELLVRKHLRPFFGPIPAGKLTTAHVQQYIEKRLAAGRANATINHELSLLRRALNLGRQATPPKVLRAPHIPKLAEDNVRKGFFERADYVKLRDALPDELKGVLTFAYFTGCRRGEILSLQWPQVDLLERVVRLEPGTTKNKEARIIPAPDELYQTLLIQRERTEANYPACPWVFSRGGEKIRHFRKTWKSACREAGLWEGDAKKGKPTKLFHDLRRTGVRNLVRAGVPEKVAMLISGHRTRSVFERYNIISEDDLKEAMRRLGSYHEGRAKAQEDKTQTGTQTENRHTIGTQTPGGKVQ